MIYKLDESDLIPIFHVSENYFDFVTLESIAPESQCLTLANQLDATLSQLQTKVLDILKKVGPSMQESLRKAMFHLAWSPDTLPTNQAMEPLFDYLHGHFLALNVSLLPQNFQRVLFEVREHTNQAFAPIHLLQIWECALVELNQQMDGGTNAEEMSAMFHDRLHNALELMAEFFHADGMGLSMELLHSETYYRVEQRLQYHRTDTESLIEIFYGHRLQEQLNITSSAYGSLAVRAYFNHDSLCVEVSDKENFQSVLFVCCF